MLGSTITLTINSIAKVLVRVNDSEPYSSTYFLEDGNLDYELSVKHTVPKTRGASKESHLVRFNVTEYDATTGDVLRVQSTWQVMEASTGRQDSTTLGYYVAALNTWVSANKALVLARDS